MLSGGAPYTGGIGGEDCIYEGYQNENVNEANGSGAIIAIGDADFADYICLDISSYCYSLELFRSWGGQADQASFVIGNQTFEYTDGSGGSYNSNFSNSVGNCGVSGCIDPTALNTHPYATVQDESCVYPNAQDTLICGNNYSFSESTTSLGIGNSVYTSFELDQYSEIELDFQVANNSYFSPYLVLFDSAQIYLETIYLSSNLDNFLSLEAGKYYMAITSGNPEFTEDDGSCI